MKNKFKCFSVLLCKSWSIITSTVWYCVQEELSWFLQFTTGSGCLPVTDTDQWKLKISRGSHGRDFASSLLFSLKVFFLIAN